MVVVVAGSVAAHVNDRQDRLEVALLNVMGKQKTKWEVVDMEKELHNLWLDGFFPEEVCLSFACSDCFSVRPLLPGWLAKHECCS